MNIHGEPVEFEPFGRRILLSCLKDQENVSSCDSATKIFRVRRRDGNDKYEEIYAVGKRAVWSCNNTTLIRTFSTDFEIIDAFWHTFNGGDDRSKHWDALCIIGERNIDIYRTDDGERFQETLPFSVRRVYSTEFGLLLERAPTASQIANCKKGSDQHFPFLFSISHPLNEIVPVIYKPTDSYGHEVVRYTTDLTLKVVHSDLRLSLMLTYDEKNGSHSLWKIKKASKQDALAASEFLQTSLLSSAASLSTSTVFSHSSLNVHKLTPSLARCGAAFFGHSPSLCQSTIGVSSSDQPTGSMQQTTATTSLSSGVLSHLFGGPPSSTPEQAALPPPLIPFGHEIRSPAIMARMFPSSTSLALTPRLPGPRTPAVMTNPAVTRLVRMNTSVDSSASLLLTPRSLVGLTPRQQHYFWSPPLNSYHAGDYLHTSTYVQSTVPFVPDLCLEPFWNESNAIARTEQQSSRKGDGMAVRAYVVEDFAGAVYFCYLVESLFQLRCVKMVEKVNYGRTISPGPFCTVSCRAVAVISEKNFMVILDQNYLLGLYSGVKKVCSLSYDAFSMLSPPDKYNMEFHKSHASRILSSSQLPSISETIHTSEARQDMRAMFSPVGNDTMDISGSNLAPTANVAAVSAVNTFCQDSPFFLMTLTSERTCRCSVSTMQVNPAIGLCLDALKNVLPSDVTVDLFSSWMVNRQLALSSSNNAQCSEIVLFMKFIMETTGFPCMNLFNKYGLGNDSLMEIPAKRSKCSEDGMDSDWDYLIQSVNRDTNTIGETFPVPTSSTTPKNLEDIENEGEAELFLRATASCFNHLPTIFYALHCCYEDMKLNQLHWSILEEFSECLLNMARALHLDLYVDHYLRDSQDLWLSVHPVVVDKQDTRQLRFPPYWSADCFSVVDHIYNILKHGKQERRVVIVGCCQRVWIVCLLYHVLHGNIRRISDVQEKILIIGEQSTLMKASLRILDQERDNDDASAVLVRILQLVKQENVSGVLADALDTFPPGIVVPLILRLTPVQFRAITRQSAFNSGDGESKTKTSSARTMCQEKTAAKLKGHEADGMAGSILTDQLAKLLFSNDLRLFDVRNMLRSSKPTKITLRQKPGVADNEFREEQERYLYSVCVRTMSLPIGRGMFTLRSHRILLAESIEIPKLCLTGRTAGPQAMSIDLSHIDVPTNMDLWAKFHNGVAAGLRLSPPTPMDTADDDGVQQHLDTSWIIYNMPRLTTPASGDGAGTSAPLNAEHAGFLFGLGLNGHLSNLALFNLHEYLVKGDTMTSIALLLGIAAAKCGTAELQSMKMLSTHLPFLLSPTLLELNIDPVVQTAAVLGVGLLYAESGNYRLAEALVREIGRPATSANDNFADRESYALSCGFALGFITLGLGDMVFGDPNFTLADELRLLMNGGHKRRHHYATDSPPSQLVKDGDFLNVHVTSAPATVALGLMYMNSNNAPVATWLDPPETLALLDTVRPDLLTLRVVCKSLIMWEDILPRVDWIENHAPAVVRRIIAMNEEDRALLIQEQFVDMETVAQSYCNIVAGACQAVALKFAGSANAEAVQTLLHYYKLFDSTMQQNAPSWWRKIYTKAGRYTTETALNVIVLSLGAVMAGTGNLDVLRIIRHLRQRVGLNCSNWLLHGGHMAAHMALGLLFLGGGRYTLSTSNLSVAALFCSIYPKFPVSPNDNRFHLQACRHLYVLACEPRLLMATDHLNLEVAYCNVSVKFKGCRHYETVMEHLRTPCMLPELKLLEEVQVNDERYWPVKFTPSQAWDKLKATLNSQTGLEICRRAGFCSRKEDPLGYQSIAITFRMHSDDWVAGQQHAVYNEASEILESLKLWCARRDCEHAYSNLVDLFYLLNTKSLKTVGVWQLKLLLVCGEEESELAGMEFLLALELKLKQQLIEGVTADALKAYVSCNHGEHESNIWWPKGQTMLGQFLTFFDLPPRSFWEEAGLREYRSLRLFLEKFTSLNIPMSTAFAVYRVMSKS